MLKHTKTTRNLFLWLVMAGMQAGCYLAISAAAFTVVLTVAVTVPIASAQSAAAFLDVPSTHPYATALETLKAANILSGYADGTFQPDKNINRAESLKIILRSVQKEPAKGLFSTGFSDVPLDAWFAGYVMAGASEGFLKGNPDGTFTPEKKVNRAEFLKMAMGAFKTDISRHQNITVAIAPDVPAGSWFLPHMSYARTIGLVYPNMDGNLFPSQELTRGQCAFILYKLLLIQQGGEAQKNLSMAEAQLVSAQIALAHGDTESAQSAVNAAADMSGKSYQMFPQSAAAKATHLMSQAFQKLVEAYQKAAEIQGVSPEGNTPDPLQTAALIEAMKQLLIQARQLADEAVLASTSVESFRTNLTTYADVLTAPEEL